MVNPRRRCGGGVSFSYKCGLISLKKKWIIQKEMKTNYFSEEKYEHNQKRAVPRSWLTGKRVNGITSLTQPIELEIIYSSVAERGIYLRGQNIINVTATKS